MRDAFALFEQTTPGNVLHVHIYVRAQTKKSLSGTKFRQMLRGGDDIPEWFAFKSVVDVLREAN